MLLRCIKGKNGEYEKGEYRGEYRGENRKNVRGRAGAEFTVDNTENRKIDGFALYPSFRREEELQQHSKDEFTYLFVASQVGNLSQICFIGSYIRSLDSS